MERGEFEHADGCADHDDEAGCATEWNGFTDGDSQLLIRTLYRPGRPAVVQVSLSDPDGRELIADFCPHDPEPVADSDRIRFLGRVAQFGKDLGGEFASAAQEAAEYWRKRNT